jgi:hypothetical protein
MDDTLATDMLALRCRQLDGGPEVDRYCYELFRRALEDRDQQAFQYIYELYLPRVRRWVSLDSLFPRGREDAGTFACDALTAFYRACNGERFAQRFPAARGIESILGYLRRCARSQLWEYWRRQNRRPAESLPEGHEVEDSSDRKPEREFALLQQHIVEQVLTTPRERRGFEVFFSLGWDPRHVPERFPDLASTDQEARLLKTRIIQRLRTAARSDPFLAEWFPPR